MSAISSVNSYNSVSYGNFASGKKIHSAADGASELAMTQKMERQERGMDAGADNIQSAKSVLNVSDGALGQITDHLQRINELAVKASSFMLSDDDRSAIQGEIDQLKQGISDIAEQTSFNGMNILDGSKTDFHIATGPDGPGKDITTGNATLEALGIQDFDVTGSFDLSTIRDALSKVSSQRSTAGAQTNALEHAYNSNRNYGFNITSSKSRLEDLDYPKAISEMKKQELMKEYQMHIQRKKMEDKKNQMSWMFQ